MFRFLALTTLVALAACQNNYHQDPKTAAIISEQRYLSGDGKFGAAYEQEDGINFKEETDSDGTRHGSYSYVDPSGQRRTISYTAGKNGFQASGDHLPQAPPAPPQPVPTAGYQPQPQYQPQQQQQQQQNGAAFSRFNPNAACFEPKVQNGPGAPQQANPQQQQLNAQQQQPLLPDAVAHAAMAAAANYGIDQKRSRFSPYNMNFSNMPPPPVNQQQHPQQQQQQAQQPHQQQQQQAAVAAGAAGGMPPQAYGQYSSMSSSMATVSLNGGPTSMPNSYRPQYAVPTQAAPYMMANGGDIYAYPPPPLPVQN